MSRQSSTNLKRLAYRLLPPWGIDFLKWISGGSGLRAVRLHERHGRIPWSQRYLAYRKHILAQNLSDESLLNRFRRGEPLPDGYGVGVDERCVEYPWLMAQLGTQPETMLDAGSCLNHRLILDQEVLKRKNLHIFTLAPETEAYWQRGISYLYGDLRNIPVRDGYYDIIACISTLEHVGHDNSMHTHNKDGRENKPADFLVAVRELRRVLKPSGSLFLTVPYGVPQQFGTQQIFDRGMLDGAIQAFGSAEKNKTFYRYSRSGWNIAGSEECADCRYVEWFAKARSDQTWPEIIPVEPDLAAAARAVACVRLKKI